MKATLILTLVLMGAASLQAAALKKAQFTRVMNDVKMVPEQQTPVPAKVGDSISGKTAVTTGAQSRAELKFEDNTLTRLGANSAFSLDEGSRTVDLKQGTLLLQVPKQLGGAKVRTAAITAAVTGTTVLIEYQPDGHIKLIVLEGQMDVFRNDNPSEFSTLKAGDMIIMKPDGKVIPAAVQVDLKRLKETSKLTDEKEFGALGNQQHLQAADQQQAKLIQSGSLQETSLLIAGGGTQVVFKTEKPTLLEGGVTILPTVTPTTTPTTTTTTPTSGKFGKPPLLGGVAVVDNFTEIITDPKITTLFGGTTATGEGRIFRPGQGDPTVGQYLFNTATNKVGTGDDGKLIPLDALLASEGTWAAFRFEELHVIGAPSIDTTGGPKNVMFASDSVINLGGGVSTLEGPIPTGDWNLFGSGLKSVAFMAADGIDWQTGYSITGTTQGVYLYTQTNGPVDVVGPPVNTLDDMVKLVPSLTGGDIVMHGSATSRVSLSTGRFTALAGRDLKLSSSSYLDAPIISAAYVNLGAVNDVNIGPNAVIQASHRLNVVANHSINITNSSQLRRLSEINPTSPLELNLIAGSGDVNITGGPGSAGGPVGRVSVSAENVQITSRGGNVIIEQANITAADTLKAHTLSPNGQLIIGGSSLTGTEGVELWAKGSNGVVLFVGDTTISGPALIAGKKVQINGGVSVVINDHNDLNVYADVKNFNLGSLSTYGNFTHNGSNLVFVPDGQTGPHSHPYPSPGKKH